MKPQMVFSLACRACSALTLFSSSFSSLMIGALVSLPAAHAGTLNDTQLQVIGATAAAQKYPNVNGTGVNVAIMDGGIDFTRPWFAAGNRNIQALDFYHGETSPTWLSTNSNVDTDGHGSAVSTFAVANGNTFRGVAPNANIMFLRINPNDQQTFVNAMKWILADPNSRGISALNLSRGPGWPDGYPLAIQLMKRNVFVGIAAGNNNPNYGATELFDSTTFRVAGSDLWGSAYGVDRYGFNSVGGPGVAIAAPGAGLWIGFPNPIEPNLASFGTSWATPQVVGTAALLKQVVPGITSAEMAYTLTHSNTRTTWDARYNIGYPLLNVVGALDTVCNFPSGRVNLALCGRTPPPSPPPPTSQGSKKFLQCKLASKDPRSWIRQRYLAGGDALYNLLGCPITGETIPKGYDGTYVYQAFAKGGYCLAWNHGNSNASDYTNFVVSNCSSLPGMGRGRRGH